MKITELECQHFAGVPDGIYSFVSPTRPTPHELTLVAGVRGAGKTRLLEAIVALKELVGAYRSAPPLASLLDPGATTGKLGGTFLLTDEERGTAELTTNEVTVEFAMGATPSAPTKIPRGLRLLFARYDHDHARGKVEYFSALRWLPPFGEPTTVEDEKSVRLGSQSAKYAGLVPSLIALSLEDGARALSEAARRGLLLGTDAPDSLLPYRTALATLLPELRLRSAHLGSDGPPRLLFDRSNGTTIEAHQLSGAQKQALLLVGTMIRIGLSHSIVLLDAPELHVHVADQGRFLQTLIQLGNDNQWIVASGSSDIMKTAQREQMIVLPSPTDGTARR